MSKLTDKGTEGKRQKITQTRLYNKVECSYNLYKKKYLFENMKNYYERRGEDPFLALPVTFHIKSGPNSPEFDSFTKYYNNE